jgi:DNA helicase-2/ATP-dependent DNA helicase PcrA
LNTTTPANENDVPEPVRDEEKVLARVLESLRTRTIQSVRRDYDEELIALRDELAEARLEDAPPLIAQMERLQAVAARRQEVSTGTLDARSPYFAHLRLREGARTRDVCLGRGTYIDPDLGVRVVDWRNAPVSRIYYRYAEGDPYEESFGDKDVEGEVLIRRDVTIVDGRLMRVGGAEATFVRGRGGWRTLAARSTRLAGGQGMAVLPTERGVLGSGEGEEGIGRRDRFLPEIAALLDPKQFEAISRPAAGVVVIQGGAGSGKTTIGLHRIAYLAFQAPKRFTHDRVMVIVPSRALATYTSRVLPALDVPNVPVATLAEWQRDARLRALPSLPSRVTDETPLAALKLKKHPTLLALFEHRVDAMVADFDSQLRAACEKAGPPIGEPVLSAWQLLRKSPIASRLAGMRRWLANTLTLPGAPSPPAALPLRMPIDHLLSRLWRRARDVVTLWADVLTDRAALHALLDAPVTPGLSPLTRADIEEAHRWCVRRCEAVIAALPQGGDAPPEKSGRKRESEARKAEQDDERADGQLSLELGDGGPLESEQIKPRRSRASLDDETRAAYLDDDELEEIERRKDAIDGRPVDEDEELGSALDAEDDAIFLRLHQLLRGPLRGRGKGPLLYEHVFVDEVQDCAAIDLAVLVECTDVVGGERSMTLAGDIAQRLTLDVGLGEFAPALEGLGLPHVEVEPLQIGYRSTRQVLELAREVLGPLAPAIPPVATRDGAPVERHHFHDAGAAAAFLAASLRDLAMREPLASVALIARNPWQADVYLEVLSRAEIPNLRRVRDQDFPFRAGVDLTDVRQVKGLEWDYVILLDVNLQSYPAEDESRHLLHIAATRAAHQLWLIASGEPSPLVGGWDE